MAKVNDSHLSNFIRKFSYALDTLPSSPPPTKQILSYLEQAKSITEPDNVILVLLNKLESPDSILKHLFDQLSPFILNSPDPSLTQPCLEFFIRSLATISRVCTDPTHWQSMFNSFIINYPGDSGFSFFIDTLKYYRPNVYLPFWWEILCSAPEVKHIDKLKQFVDIFMIPLISNYGGNSSSSMSSNLTINNISSNVNSSNSSFPSANSMNSVNPSSLNNDHTSNDALYSSRVPRVLNSDKKNTITNAVKIIKSINNIENRNRFTTALIIPVFDIHITHVGSPPYSIFSFKAVFNKAVKAREHSIKLLQVIKSQGEDELKEFLRYIVFVLNNYEMQTNNLKENNEWIIEALRLRKIMNLVYQIVPNANAIFQYVIDSIANLKAKSIIAFAVQFDTKQSDFIVAHANEPHWNQLILDYIGHLSIIFAPLFLDVNHSELEMRTNETKTRNKRMKVQKVDEILENVDEIFTNPMFFETRIDNSRKSFLLRLYLKKEKTNLLQQHSTNNYKTNTNANSNSPIKYVWSVDEAFNHLQRLIQASGKESQCISIFIKRFSEIQKRLVNYFPTMNHDFLAKKFLDSCLTDLSIENLTAARQVVECSSYHDLEMSQRNKYVDYIENALKSNLSNQEIKKVASDSVYFCLSHFSPYSFKLCSPFLAANPQPSFNEYVIYLTSIYSIVFNTNNMPNRSQMLNILINIFNKFVQNEPRNEKLISMMITLLFEEISSNSPQVSEGLKSLYFSFFQKKDDTPQNSIRMLTLFNTHYETINQKFPLFYENLVECIKELLMNKKINNNVFQVLCDNLADTFLHYPNGRDKMLEIKEELMPHLDPSTHDNLASKRDMFNFAVDQFISKFNHPLIEIEPENEETNEYRSHSYAVIDKIALQRMNFTQDCVNIASKTKNGTLFHNVSLNSPKIRFEKPTRTEKQFPPIENVETDFMKSFSSFVDEFSTSVVPDYPNYISGSGNQLHNNTNSDIYINNFHQHNLSSGNVLNNLSTATTTTNNNEFYSGWTDCKPSDFLYNCPIKKNNESYNSQHPQQRQKDQYSNRSSMNFGKNETTTSSFSDPKVILPSKHATSFYTSIFNEIETSYVQDPRIIFLQPFQLLDINASQIFGSHTRETIKLGLLFVENGQTDQNKILQNEWKNVSSSFRSFVSSLGTIVDLATHTGFTGKLDTSTSNFSNGRYQLYYANDRFEMMFHTAPLLPTDLNDDQQIYKKRHIGNDYVHIIWSEHGFDYERATITSQFNDAHIIIYPIEGTTDFIRVAVYRKDKGENEEAQMKFGPLLLGESIISKNAMPDLVRWTAIFADRIAREYKLPNSLFLSIMNDFLKTERSKSK
ncbi:hypothetical protein TRFO_26025 [Tritrichomonas foetus]|uniref:Rap-GAP domain-containing protein n=1 Tax=Tritrichomonas foetus TaxID=1144522 RepID=A0A1J4K4I1_9EUKA|nr:hypothetical protein TRFO_26025 [Tritrichomonas foetus]|eukprot:OHT06099.1 hypothetical protein TRFO_26025 [Tritrichomonas foetus]